jgi:general secretion pathway protein J
MPASSQGFSLLEILLALTLMALLMGGAYAGIRTATRSAEGGEALIERTSKLRVTQELLRRQLSQALMLSYDERPGTGERIVFEGERDTLTWVSTMPGYLGRGGAYVQQLRLEHDSGGQRMEFRHILLNGYDPQEVPVGDGEPVILLENIDDAYFEYRAMGEDGKLADWTDEWDKPGQLPMLVRVHVEFARAARMPWPDLVIPLLVDPGAVGAAQEPSFFTSGGG